MGISAMGFFILVEKDKKVRDAVDIFFDPSILMCIAGIIIFMLGFFGCLGALRENICLLKTVSAERNNLFLRSVGAFHCCFQCLPFAVAVGLDLTSVSFLAINFAMKHDEHCVFLCWTIMETRTFSLIDFYICEATLQNAHVELV